MNTLFLFLLFSIVAVNGFMTGQYVSGEMRWQTGWSKWLLLAGNALCGFLLWTLVIPCLFIYVAFDEYVRPIIKFLYRVWFTDFYEKVIKEKPEEYERWVRLSKYDKKTLSPIVRFQVKYVVRKFQKKDYGFDKPMTEAEYLECIGAVNVWVVLIGCICVSIGAGILKLILG